MLIRKRRRSQRRLGRWSTQRLERLANISLSSRTAIIASVVIVALLFLVLAALLPGEYGTPKSPRHRPQAERLLGVFIALLFSQTPQRPGPASKFSLYWR